MDRALQRHPDNAALYVLAASHELAHGATDSARALLQRGIRLAGDGTKDGATEIWVEYVKMEMGFVEGLRRRWNVLGIGEEGKGKEKEKDTDEGEDDGERGEKGGKSEKARREIMSGAIIKDVISCALEGQSFRFSVRALVMND
jgi:U3 small nucleolar RNA-associated protein 6